MLTQEIRRKFLKYFQDHGHSIVPSSPVIPHDDPTLLFINAGMNQFKDVFLGETTRDYTRATSSQKCVRVGGKHNDLENVGHTKRHLTFFEMLGNFSFGDYFKEDSIRFSWEVSTEIFGFDPERIWPTVFQQDDEAFEIWKKYVPEDRITRFPEKHNFWAMGDTGPCGPCSELLFDRGPEYGDAPNPTADVAEERYMEFWNLVFMQYNRDASGKMEPLPKPSIDTGAGLERIVALKMGVDTVYDTDVLRALIDRVEEVSGKKYDPNQENSAAYRVIADHLRCLAFAIADGVQPSNIERGYVLRKVLRRAVRYGRQLGMNKPFLAEVMPCLVEMMGGDYKELVTAQDRIAEILVSEEEAFIRTLKRGGNILNQIMEHAQKHGKQITGDEAFKLKDTYGFPLEEILLLAKDADLTVDTKRFGELEGEARERSRQVHKKTQQVASENLFMDYEAKHGECEFTGFTESSTEAEVTAIVVDDSLVQEISAGEEGMIVLNRTSFYSEKGGQVGDTGFLEAPDRIFEVNDCQSPYKNVIAHSGKVLKGKICVGDTLMATVDAQRHQRIANNHTATHLLHWALQKVLGEHVRQAGSVVDPERLRFDFSHHKALSSEEIRVIEDLVNTKIRENISVQGYEISYDEAQNREDIKQFFGEKYGATVRVVDMDYSKELCGGTHTSQVGNIGLFRIAKEGSIAAGIRRIEAVTGPEAEALSRESEDEIHDLATLLKTQPAKIPERVTKLVEENKALVQELKQAKISAMQGQIASFLEKVEHIGEIPFLSLELELSASDVKPFADALMDRWGSGVLVIGSKSDGKCQVLCRVSDDFVAKGIKAGEIIKQIAPLIEGGGGGKPNMAQAGGKAPQKLGEALGRAREIVSGGDVS